MDLIYLEARVIIYLVEGAPHHRSGALWTNDERLTHASHGLVRNVLDNPT